MAIHYVTIKGRIKNGKLDAELPDNVIDGEAEIIIPVANSKNEGDEPIHFSGLTVGEILASDVIGGWQDRNIPDSLEYLAELRRKEEEQRNLWTRS